MCREAFAAPSAGAGEVHLGGGKMRGNFAAIALIVIGGLALASNLGLFDVDLGQVLRTWWPLLLIILGIGMFLAPGTEQRRKRD
jgi:hypothetical protein